MSRPTLLLRWGKAVEGGGLYRGVEYTVYLDMVEGTFWTWDPDVGLGVLCTCMDATGAWDSAESVRRDAQRAMSGKAVALVRAGDVEKARALVYGKQFDVARYR